MHSKITFYVYAKIGQANGGATELCDRIVNAWEELDQRVIDAAVLQWRARLRACVCSGWTL